MYVANRTPASPRTLWVVWGAILGSIPLYLFVGIFYRMNAGLPPQAPGQGPLTVLAGSAPLAVLAPLLLAMVAGVLGHFVVPGLVVGRAPFQTWSILRWALAETAVLCGLVGWFLGGTVVLLTLGAVLSAALMALSMPTARSWKDYEERARERARA